jgi:hypothetical protein
MSTVDNTTQAMMTLAALGATAATERPSGETLEEQERRILAGINSQLANTSLATAGEWRAIWVGLTASRANLAYIAQKITNLFFGHHALCLRGTMAGSPIDTSEDMEVGMMLPFTAGGGPGKISQGAMEAFTDIIMGTDLMIRLGKMESISSLCVTGHSLGGALATTISLYLAQGHVQKGLIHPYTFAAPTAGDADFANWFDTQFPSAKCYYNYYDLVPNAWATLADIYEDPSSNPFYPNPPGPTAGAPTKGGLEIKEIIKSIAQNVGVNSYVQPTQQTALNHPLEFYYTPYPQGAVNDVQQFEVQVGYQHANNTYLKLLKAAPLSNVAPMVATVNPNSGPTTGGTAVTISAPDGYSFSPDSVVDFGIAPAASATVADDGSTITAISPPGVGTVDIRVTNIYGTSPVAPVYPNLTPYDYNDQFTFQPGG